MIKSQKRSHKTVEFKVFLTILLNGRRIRIQEAQKHVDPVDPDPDSQHWFISGYIVVQSLFICSLLNIEDKLKLNVYIRLMRHQSALPVGTQAKLKAV
jgi:hypothetical protein